MLDTKSIVESHLKELLGLKLSIARRAADMRVFHFGDVHTTDASYRKRDGTLVNKVGTIGEFALHLQSWWRIDGIEQFFVSSRDLWVKADGTTPEDWDYEKSENLQDQLIATLLQGKDPVTGSSLNTTNLLTVESIEANSLGDFTVTLTGSYNLRCFVDSLRGEAWRLIKNDDRSPHLVFSDGRVDSGWLIP